MALKSRFMSPLGIGALLVALVVVAVLFLSLAAPQMSSPVYSNIRGSFNQELAYSEPPAQPASAPADAGFYAGAVAGDGVADILADTNAQALNRIILRSASLRIVVEAADVSLAAISALAGEMGGWVVTSSTSMVTTPAGQQVARGSITIRVPSGKLDSALSQIKSGAGKVESENVSGQDVTQDYVDLSSRLTNLEAAEAQLRTILDDARRTEDVLAVYSQLVTTRGEIERIRGQIQYYDEASAYSSISVELIPQAIETPIQIAGWSPGRTVENALATLINVLQAGVDLLITLVVLGLPLVLVALVPVWFIRRVLRRRAAANAA